MYNIGLCIPLGEHHLCEQGGGHQLRPARGQRAHPDLQPWRLAAAGGPAAGAHPARQEGRHCGRVQRLLLHPGVPGHGGDVLQSEAAALSRQPGLCLQGEDKDKINTYRMLYN